MFELLPVTSRPGSIRLTETAMVYICLFKKKMKTRTRGA